MEMFSLAAADEGAVYREFMANVWIIKHWFPVTWLDVVWMSYSSISSHYCQISFFHSQLKPMTVKENGRGCKPHQSFMYGVVELDKAPSFFHIPPKKMGFSYSFSFETQPLKPPFCINSTKPDNTESFTSFTPSPSPFSQVHFPKLKLHYTAILLSRGKVIIFRCCRHPLSVV